MHITPISLWFMVLITIVNGVYKPTYNWGAPPCGDYRCFFQENSSLGEDVCCQNWRKSCVKRLKLERTAVVCMCFPPTHSVAMCRLHFHPQLFESYLRHVRRHPKPSARSAAAIKKIPGTICWYPMELGKSSTLRGHTLW